MMSKTKTILRSFLSRFIIVGIFNYIFAVSSFSLIWLALRGQFSFREISYVVAILSIIVSLLTQSFFTLRKLLGAGHAIFLFLLQYLNLELSIILVPRLSNYLGINVLFVQGFWVATFTLVSFTIYLRIANQSCKPLVSQPPSTDRSAPVI